MTGADFFRSWKAFALAALVAAAAYAPALSCGFVWDDALTVSSNTFVHDWKNFPLIFTRQYLTSPNKLHLVGQEMVGAGEASYRPVVTVTYFLDHAIWKLNPRGYHLTNLMLHAVCVCLVYGFLLMLIGHPLSAFWAALIFAVHPVHTEAVIGISMREDLLVGVFYLASLMFYRVSVRSSIHRTRNLLWALITYALALFSKEMAVTLPVMLWLMDQDWERKKGSNSDEGSVSVTSLWIHRLARSVQSMGVVVFARRYWGFYALTLGYLWVWKYGMGRSEGFSAEYPGGHVLTNIFTMLKVLGIYCGWILAPWTVYPTLPPADDFTARFFFSPMVAPSLLGLLTLSLMISVWRRQRPLVGLGWLWFWVTLLPVMNILPLQNIYAARFLYVPLIGLSLILAVGLKDMFLRQNRWIRPHADCLHVILAVIVMFYAAIVFVHHGRWKDDLSFRMSMVRDYPLHLGARVGLAHAYRNQLKDSFLAIEQFKVVQVIDPGYLNNLADLATEYLRVGDQLSAIRVFEDVVARQPRNILAWDALCSLKGNAGRYQEATGCFENILKRDPSYFKAYTDLQLAYLLLGQQKKAAIVGLRALVRVTKISRDPSKK